MREAFLVSKPNGLALRALNYTPAVENLRTRHRTSSTTLRSLISEMGPAYGSVFTRVDCDRDYGIELIAQGDMFAAEPVGRIIRRDSMARPEQHLVKSWQVLIAGAGTLGEHELFGRPVIADSRIQGSYVGPDAMVLTFREPGSDESLFAYAFMLTRIGLRAIRATCCGTKILRLRKDLLNDLPIPLPNSSVRGRVASLIRRYVEQIEIYLREVRAARRTLEELEDMREARKKLLDKSAKATLWAGTLPTLRAWNFVSAGHAMSFLTEKWSRRLSDALDDGGLFGGDRFARIPCQTPHGVLMLSQRDVFAIRPVPRRIVRPIGLQLGVNESTLLLASRGQIKEGNLFGRIERGAHMPSGAIVTGDCTRLQTRPALSAGLYAYFSTEIGRSLLRSTAYGTSIPGMRADLLLSLPIPSDELLLRSVPHVEAATVARRAAAQAEGEAIHIIEAEVLASWLG